MYNWTNNMNPKCYFASMKNYVFKEGCCYLWTLILKQSSSRLKLHHFQLIVCCVLKKALRQLWGCLWAGFSQSCGQSEGMKISEADRFVLRGGVVATAVTLTQLPDTSQWSYDSMTDAHLRLYFGVVMWHKNLFSWDSVGCFVLESDIFILIATPAFL